MHRGDWTLNHDECNWLRIGQFYSRQNCVFEKYPLHTQAVELAIKSVSEAFSKVGGQYSRDGYIHTVPHQENVFRNFTQEKTTQHKLHELDRL